jgi:hypothetical protein
MDPLGPELAWMVEQGRKCGRAERWIDPRGGVDGGLLAGGRAGGRVMGEPRNI